MSAITQIRLSLDHIAAGREAAQAAWAGGTALWDLVDAAADHAFENALKGSDLDAVDAALKFGGVKWSAAPFPTFFQNLQTYLVGQGATAPLLDTYLGGTGGFRVPFFAAESYAEALNSRLTTPYVFPRGVLPAGGSAPTNSGMHLFGTLAAGTGVWTPGSGALSNMHHTATAASPATIVCVGACVVAINLSAAQTAGVTMTCLCQDGVTTKDIAVSYAASAQYTQKRLGEQAINTIAGGTGAAGQKVVNVAATAQFTVGDYVLIYESDALQEIAQVASISLNASLTMTSNLVNTYSVAAKVLPLFIDANPKNGTQTGSNNIAFYALPDRTVAL